MINLFRPLFLVSTRPHRISRLTFLFYSLNLLHKVTYIFWALACYVVLPSYTALVLSFCSSSQDFDTHFLYFHLTMDSLCFSMWLAIYTSTTDFHRLVKRHACRTLKKAPTKGAFGESRRTRTSSLPIDSGAFYLNTICS